MQIQKITSSGFNKTPLHLKDTGISTNHKYNNIPICTLNAENIKANFLPSFGKFYKIADVMLKDRISGYDTPAVLKKEKITKNDFNYKLYVRGKEAGYMTLYCESLIPEEEYVAPVANNIFPEVHYLRSLKGNEYEGIGSLLMQTAINESKKRGHNGALWLITDNTYARSESAYRSGENPIPFYYKLGLRALNPNEDKEIQLRLKEGKYNMLPDSSILVLTEEAANANNKYLARNFTVI